MKYNIEAKASMHVGKKYSLKHNLREYDATKWNTDGHIQSDRSHLNERLTHTELRDFFQKTFGAAIDQYNEKNREKHPDRMTSVDDYYNKYKGHAQECIMQMGDHENYMELIKLVGQEKADSIHKQFLTRAYNNWLKDNPSLKVFSATIHMDEIKDGTPHIHIDFLPVAESSRGLTVKVSMDGAMKKLGYDRKTKAKDGENDSYKETPYRRWLSQQRERVESLADEYVHLIPSQPFTKRRRQETWQWRAQQKEALVEDVKQLSETKVQAEKDIAQLRTEYKQYRDLEIDKEDLSQKIRVKAGHFGKNETVVMDKADFDKIQEQSAAYVANYDKIKFADERSSDLDEREKRLNEAEKRIEEEKKEIENERQIANAAALKKQKEADAILFHAKNKQANADMIKRNADRLYMEQKDINNTVKELKDRVRYVENQIIIADDKAERYLKELKNSDLEHKKEVTRLEGNIQKIQGENRSLKQSAASLKDSLYKAIRVIAYISNHLKYELKKGDLSDVSMTRLKGAQLFAEEMCTDDNLSPEQKEFITNIKNKGVLSKEVRDIVLNIREEMKKEEEQEQDHYYGMTR